LRANTRQGCGVASVVSGGHSFPLLSVLLSAQSLSIGFDSFFSVWLSVDFLLGQCAQFHFFLIIVFAFCALVDCGMLLMMCYPQPVWHSIYTEGWTVVLSSTVNVQRRVRNFLDTAAARGADAGAQRRAEEMMKGKPELQGPPHSQLWVRQG
jgi:hypothetical protein